MRCDVRPVISDGDNLYTDPFAEPISCNCPSSPFIRLRLACKEHGCCMQTSKKQLCSDLDACNTAFEVHHYVQAQRRQPRNIWGPYSSSFWSIPVAPEQQKPWVKIRNLEDCLFMQEMPHLTTISDAFEDAIQNLIATGRRINSTQEVLDKLRTDIAIRRAMHIASHGEACERVLNEWECAARGPIATGEAMAKQMSRNLAKNQELFLNNWGFIYSIMCNKQTDAKQFLVKKSPVIWDQ
ncbi:hypothetical protein F53441_14081 [Fusarium austroafricanum]|uniref:Uncharacterized protein n=1 Tax=Fusarium austroafricanum TaxID=2364996 RepID=A0A8H4JHP6_9HYPO|nr:hypothetical protein F53441_14081 [Fusarium austroafricanum]